MIALISKINNWLIRTFIVLISFLFLTISSISVSANAINYEQVYRSHFFNDVKIAGETSFKTIKNDLANCCQNQQDLLDYRDWCLEVEAVDAKGVSPFGLRSGYGVFGEKGLKLGNYRMDLMYANPSAGQGAGTIFSLKQMKQGGALWRWDYGKLHTTGNMGLHSTVRFHWNGVKYGSTAQRTWYPSTFKAPFFKALD